MKTLVINCGSSSLKYQLINSDGGAVLVKGTVDRIGLDGTNLELSLPNGTKEVLQLEKGNHKGALEAVFASLTNPSYKAIDSLKEIDAIGHRVVHGGENFTVSSLITKEVLQGIKDCANLAPLHNPPNITGIEAATEILGDKLPQVAVFDTAFHSKMPKEAAIYPLPYEFYEKHKVRRYGFHGTSHKFVAQRAIEILNLDPKKAKIITCHIGNGGSVAAVLGDHSIDTSMGLTPLEGLMMGTRCGDIDPAITFHLIDNCGYTSKQLNDIYNKQSGLKGVSGLTNDMRDVMAAAEQGNERAKIAFAVFNYKIKKYIGSYLAALGGADVIIFTAGVGENNAIVRSEILSNLSALGIEIDSELNKTANRKEQVFSTPSSKVKVMVIPTNEELMIARETAEVVSALR